jgi:hypothetical protein
MTDDSNHQTNVKYVVDSDILIYFFKKNKNVVERFTGLAPNLLLSVNIQFYTYSSL